MASLSLVVGAREAAVAALVGIALGSPVTVPAAQGAFPGDPGQIAFATSRDGDGFGIYVMDADGSHETRLTRNTVWDTWPRWSPDGGRIVFNRADDIWVMRANEALARRLTDTPTGETAPAWSPDGRHIVYVSDEDGHDYEIHVMRSDGAGDVALTDNAVTDSAPAWSPDGSTIAFMGMDGADLDVFVMDADGSDPVNLTPFSAGHDAEPTWSPDGSSIAFTRPVGQRRDVWVMDADGTDARFVAQGAPGAATPAFSPDGRRIVFAHGDPPDLYSVRLDGTGRRRLTDDPLSDTEPDQRPRCTITGTAGDDVIAGTDGADLIGPLGGDDVVSAGRGADVVFGDYGDDVISGGRGRDLLVGDWGEDTLRGNQGNHRIVAGTGDVFPRQVDLVAGGEGVDVCRSDAGDAVSGCP